MGAEIEMYTLTLTEQEADEKRRAAIRVADQLGNENPDPRDDLMPKLVGRELAKTPAIAAGVRELLDQLGLKDDEIRRRP